MYTFFDSMILHEMAVFSVLKRERRKKCEYTLKLNLSKLKNQTNIHPSQILPPSVAELLTEMTICMRRMEGG